MKQKLLYAATICTALSTNAFAETESITPPVDDNNIVAVSEDASMLIYHDTVYVPKRETKADFFVGLELPLLTYNTTKFNYGNTSEKNSELIMNKGIFDNSSLAFGFCLNDAARIAFGISHYHSETELDGADSEYSIGSYGVTLDAMLTKNKPVSPFVRLGVGYLNVEQDSEDFSTAVFNIGFGVNYKITENTFSYMTLEYAFIPETELDDTDIEVEGGSLGFMLGLGYQF